MVSGGLADGTDETGPFDISPLVMPEFSQFETQYFIQTRREIDTEKQERNKLLHYALLAAGAIALALSQLDRTTKFLESPAALGLYCSLFLLVWGIVAARRAKLRQIYDRWISLYTMLRTKTLKREWIPVEETVLSGIKSGRYLYEDLWLHLGLSSLIYGLIVMGSIQLVLDGNSRWLAFVNLIIPVHLLLTGWRILCSFELSQRARATLASSLTYEAPVTASAAKSPDYPGTA